MSHPSLDRPADAPTTEPVPLGLPPARRAPLLWQWIVGGSITLAAIAAIVFMSSPADKPFSAPPGSLATTEAEQSLLNLHEAMGTPNITTERAQRAIIDQAKLICRHLDEGTTTPAFSTAIAIQAGLDNAATFVDFAIHALCRHHEK